MAVTLAPLKKRDPEKPIAANEDPRLAFSERMPEQDASDLEFRAKQQDALKMGADEIAARNLAGSSQAGAGLLSSLGAQPGGAASSNLAASALQARANRLFGAQTNSLAQAQRFEAPQAQFKNTLALSGENQKDLEFIEKRQAVRNAIDANNRTLSLADKQMLFQEYMADQDRYLQEKHRELSDFIYKENKRKMASAARNQIIGTILTTGGTVIGGVLGGPAGAIGGGAAGGAASKAVAPGSGSQTALPNAPTASQVPTNDLNRYQLEEPELRYPRNTTRWSL